MQQVGRTILTKVMRSGKETRSYMTYKDVPKDNDEWVDAYNYLPRLYDLVHLRMNDGSQSKGWRTDTRWDGRKFKPHQRIVAWKKAEEMVLE